MKVSGSESRDPRPGTRDFLCICTFGENFFMLQRKQSLFMLMAVIAIIASYFFSFGTIHSTETLEIRSYGVKEPGGNYLSTVSSYWLYLPMAINAWLTSWALLRFKDRKRQIFLLRLTFFLFAVSFVLLALYISDAQRSYPDAHISAGPAFIFPPLALVLNWLAARLIRKDEELVRSVDRIR